VLVLFSARRGSRVELTNDALRFFEEFICWREVYWGFC